MQSIFRILEFLIPLIPLVFFGSKIKKCLVFHFELYVYRDAMIIVKHIF